MDFSSCLLDLGGSERVTRENKKQQKSTLRPVLAPSCMQHELAIHGSSVLRGEDNNASQQTETGDYRKFTVLKLKQELTKHDFGDELLKLRQPSKKGIIALYERCITQRS